MERDFIMNLFDVLTLIGGLSLFLFGMNIMGQALERKAGNKLKDLLAKMTNSKFKGFLTGLVITAVIQSSSDTTVMVVGFVNSGLMTLRQAINVIMGANIGTTITGQLIALDIGAVAPLLAFVGVFLIYFVKNERLKPIGMILAGLGILFIGMGNMSSAMAPLRESKLFIDLLTNFSNPVIGILVGAIFTAVIQSSSASVGILQALAASGLIHLNEAVFVLFGQNIGTCITAIIASSGASREAKQTTIIHLLFNTIGTVLFTILAIVTPLVSLVESFTPLSTTSQIANMHTLFNIGTTLLLIPFGNYLASFAEYVLPNKQVVNTSGEGLLFLKPLPKSNKLLGDAAINVQQVKYEVLHMLDLAYMNIYDSLEQLVKYDKSKHDVIVNREKQVNYLNEQIADYITTAFSENTINPKITHALASYYLMLADLERMSDYAINVENQASLNLQQYLSESYHVMIDNIGEQTRKMHSLLDDAELAESQDKIIDELIRNSRNDVIYDLKNKQINSEAGIMLSRILTDFERINDHALNVAQEFGKISLEYDDGPLVIDM